MNKAMEDLRRLPKLGRMDACMSPVRPSEQNTVRILQRLPELGPAGMPALDLHGIYTEPVSVPARARHVLVDETVHALCTLP